MLRVVCCVACCVSGSSRGVLSLPMSLIRLSGVLAVCMWMLKGPREHCVQLVRASESESESESE